MSNDQVKAIDLNERCAEPAEDDCRLTSIEINFAIPTYLSQAQQGQLIELISKVVKDPKNAPKEGLHWLGFIGGKMSFSNVDSALLERAPSADPPADGEEPTSKDDVLCLESYCRSFSSEQERERTLEARRPSEFTCPKCGGHTYGSNIGIGEYIRYCNGRGQRGRFQDGVFVPLEGPNEPRIRCSFTWPEGDDRKYGLKPPRQAESTGTTDGTGSR